MLRHSLVKVLLMALIWCSAPVMLFAQGQTVTVDGVAYEVGFLTGSFDENRSDLTNTTTAPWYGNAGLALTFAEAYKSQVGTAPLITNSLETLNFIYGEEFPNIRGYYYNDLNRTGKVQLTSSFSNAEVAFAYVITASPLSEFAANEAEIRAVIVNDAAQSLSSNLSINRRMTQEARDRFIEGRRQMADQASALASRNNVPFDIDGSFEMKGLSLTTRGNFFEQTGNYEGTYRRLFFGDFDVQHDADTDSTTATLTARVAWEHLITDQTMMGYFVGGELARSTINGTFDGDQDRLGLTIGGYAVHELVDQVYFDSFLTFGAGRNDLEMDNNVLALTSDYTTRTATAGAALSNVYEYQRYEFHPELAFSYGKTWIDDVDFTGRAYGLVDNTLSLDAGTVSITNLTLRPEVIWALDGDTVATSNSQLGFAPRLICESRETVGRTEDCGGGAELSLSSVSEDGLSAAEFRIILDRVGSSNRSSFTLNLKHRF